MTRSRAGGEAIPALCIPNQQPGGALARPDENQPDHRPPQPTMSTYTSDYNVLAATKYVEMMGTGSLPRLASPVDWESFSDSTAV